MIKTKQKQEAIDAYITKSAEIQAMLERLNTTAADHFGDTPDEITWGHVGFLSTVEEKLQHVSDMVFKEGEYAPDNGGTQ